MVRDDAFWEREPLYGTLLGNGEIAVLWASVAMGFPALYAGSRLSAPAVDGGFGFGPVELVLAVALGALIGGLLLGIGAWASANVAVPGDVLLRPALGRAGSAAVSILISLLLAVVAAIELRTGAMAVNDGIVLAGGPDLAAIGWVGAALAAAAMAWAGLTLVARFWFRRVAVWLALVTSLFLLWRLWSDTGLTGGSGAGRFMQGVDSVAGIALLLFPLLPMMVRFAGAPSVAASVTTTAFAAPALVLPLLGAASGVVAGGTPDPTAVALGLVGGAGGTAVAVLLLIWLVAVQLDQPFLYGLSSAGWAAGALDRRGSRATVLAVLAAAIFVGAVIPSEEYAAIVGLGVAILVPVAAVFLADFFVLRARSYNSDALYTRGGTYATVNVLGVLMVLVGFALYQWITPTGPFDMVDTVTGILPGGRSLADRFGDVPPGILSFAATFVLYSGLGRLFVRDEVSVSRITGRF